MIFEMIAIAIALVATAMTLGTVVKHYKSGSYYVAAIFMTLALYFATLVVSCAWCTGMVFFGGW